MQKLPLLFLYLLSVSSFYSLNAMPPMLRGARLSEGSEHDSRSISRTTSASDTIPIRENTVIDPLTSRMSLITQGTPLSIASPETSVLLPIEAKEYCEFLNALLPTERRAFYYGILIGKENIIFDGGLNSCRILPGQEEQPLTISQTAALHYCNWQENNAPSYGEDPDSTEYGTYDLEGKNGILSINTKASFFIPGILGINPDTVPVSELVLVLLVSQKSSSIKKIPERSLSSIQNKEVFSNADFTKEWNNIQEAQAKWDIHFKKALIKKSKKAPEVLSEAPKIKISLEQKIRIFEEQLKSIPTAKRDQLEKLIKACETLLDTVKHTHNVVEARVALSKTSTLFLKDSEAQKKLEETLQWAKLNPEQRAREFEFEIQRKPIEQTTSFETTDTVWKLVKETSELILHYKLEKKIFEKLAIRAQVDLDSFKSAMAFGNNALTGIVEKLSTIASTAQALDSRILLPLDGIKELLNLIIKSSTTLLAVGADTCQKYLKNYEDYLDSTYTYAQEQFVSLSAYAEALEKNSLLEESEKTLQKASVAKSKSPIPDSLLWEIWGRRVSYSKAILATTYETHHKNIRKAKNQLLAAEQQLAIINQQHKTLVAAMTQADHHLDQATQPYIFERSTDRTPEELLRNGAMLMKATKETVEQAHQLRKITQEKEAKESEIQSLTETLHDTTTLAQRIITRAENFATTDEEVWYFVWPHKAPNTINQDALLLRSERSDPVEIKNSFLLAQQIAVIRGIFNQLYPCYNRFEEAFSNHITGDKSFAKSMKKQADLFAKTAERIKTSTGNVTRPKETDRLYHMTEGAFEISDISNSLKVFLQLIVKEVSPDNSNPEGALEHQIAFLSTDFGEKIQHLQINGWANEIEWAQEVIGKLTSLVESLRGKEV